MMSTGRRDGSVGTGGGDFARSVAHVWAPDGANDGAGFLVTDSLLVTCAHVLGGHPPVGPVTVWFPNLGDTPVVARLIADRWWGPDSEDVAFLQLEAAPAGARALSLGSARGRRGRALGAYGFPAQAPPGGHYGEAVAGELLPRSPVRLQLTSANDLARGFSGSPVVDRRSGLVIGMVSSITRPDDETRGLGIAYAIPTEVLRELLPDLELSTDCPYRGLEAFTSQDARWFFGRDAAVEKVLAGLGRDRRLILVLGPSGSGKSSLVQAGVLPALDAGELPGSDHWLQLVARPSTGLRAALDADARPTASNPAPARSVDPPGGGTESADLTPRPHRVVVIDQFEELLAHAGTLDGEWALTRLQAVGAGTEPISVLLVMRDEFYPLLAARAPDLLANPVVNVPATLTTAELHAIVSHPVEEAGWRLEEGLADRIVADAVGSPGQARGRSAPATVLPLLEFTLTQLWERCPDGLLTHEAYQRIGGVSGGLAEWCQDAYVSLPDEDKLVAQAILTALVQDADAEQGIPATRRRRAIDQLPKTLAVPSLNSDSASHSDAFASVLDLLTRKRIVVTSRDPQTGEATAELVHEAVLAHWPLLQAWLRDDRAFRQWIGYAEDQHRRWTSASEEPDLVLRGRALEEGLEWAHQRTLPHTVSALLEVSRRRRDAAKRRARRINVTLATLAALALALAGLASLQTTTARDQARLAIANGRLVPLGRHEVSEQIKCWFKRRPARCR